jgi:hypothetical protein
MATDILEALFQAGCTYRTRDGREARVYATDGAGDYPIHGATRWPREGWEEATWTAEGRYCPHQGKCGADLILPVRS